jgi:hypothetical protein
MEVFQSVKLRKNHDVLCQRNWLQKMLCVLFLYRQLHKLIIIVPKQIMYSSLAPNGPLKLYHFIIIVAVVLAFLSQLPSFHSLRHINFASLLLCLGYTILVSAACIRAGILLQLSLWHILCLSFPNTFLVWELYITDLGIRFLTHLGRHFRGIRCLNLSVLLLHKLLFTSYTFLSILWCMTSEQTHVHRAKDMSTPQNALSVTLFNKMQ